MTEGELRSWFKTKPNQPQEFVEETVRLTSVYEVQRQARIKYGHELSSEEAESTSSRWRKEFVEEILVREAGGLPSRDLFDFL